MRGDQRGRLQRVDACFFHIIAIELSHKMSHKLSTNCPTDLPTDLSISLQTPNYPKKLNRSARLLAATTLRNVLGTKNLGDILSERESIAHELHELLYEATEPWGVQVERVEVETNTF